MRTDSTTPGSRDERRAEQPSAPAHPRTETSSNRTSERSPQLGLSDRDVVRELAESR